MATLLSIAAVPAAAFHPGLSAKHRMDRVAWVGLQPARHAETTRNHTRPSQDNASSKALASIRSAVSKPSVNQL